MQSVSLPQIRTRIHASNPQKHPPRHPVYIFIRKSLISRFFTSKLLNPTRVFPPSRRTALSLESEKNPGHMWTALIPRNQRHPRFISSSPMPERLPGVPPERKSAGKIHPHFSPVFLRFSEFFNFTHEPAPIAKLILKPQLPVRVILGSSLRSLC